MRRLTQKQREVLEDVLKVIRKPNIRVQKGGYFRVSSRSLSQRAVEAVYKFKEQDAPLHSDLFKDAKISECVVCARGALFLATVDRYNSVNVKDVLGEALAGHRFKGGTFAYWALRGVGTPEEMQKLLSNGSFLSSP